ncbi:MAG: efflux RND transporter permease subunit [Muribaculaceae bacterium]
MLDKIIHASLRSRLTVLVITAVILVAGVVMLMRSEVDIFPDLNAPTVVVMTEAPGLAPEEIEKIVTYPVETAVNGATGVQRVMSTSTSGFSVVRVVFDWDTEIFRARQIVQERLAGIAGNLPEGVSAPVMGPQSSILGEMYIIGLQADSTSVDELRSIAERRLRPRLLALGGVSQVSVIGGQETEYRIILSPERMRYHDVTLSEAVAATERVNENAGGGVIYEYGNEYIVKTDFSTTDPDDIARAVVRSDERGTVTLADIAQVTIGGKQPRLGTASVDGKPAVLVTVTKQPGAGTIELTDRIEKAIESLAPSLPHDISFKTDIFRQSDFISSSISNLQESLLVGALMVIIVLFVFLMDVRTTVISVIALPVSIIVTVIVMRLMGMTINTMSLGGIAIAIGSLVDDAIVDVENVLKRLRRNHALPPEERKSIIDVVFHASAEVRMPIFNSSLIIIAGFLPLFFLTGIEGRMLIPLGISFIVALIASTAVALTLTPVLCSLLLGTKKQMERIDREPRISVAMKRLYSRALTWTLGHGRTVLIATVALFAVALGLFFTLGRGFLPPFNEGSFTINVSTLPGISLDESDRVGRLAEEIILSVPEINTTARKTGRAELDEHSLGVNVSEIEAPYTLSGRSRAEVADELRHKLSQLPGVNVEIGQPVSHRIDAMLSGTQSQIAIKIFGPDLDRLFSVGNSVRNVVAAVPGVVDPNIEQQMQRPQLDIRPRRALLARYGITMADFRSVVETAIGGKVVSQVYKDDVPYDVTLILDDAARGSIEDIADIIIDSPQGKIPLSTVADIVSASGPNTINREDVKRRIVVSANVSGRDLRSTVDEIQRRVAQEVPLPEGYYITYGGQFENQASASRTLLWTTLGALVIMFMLLYHQFHSVSQSLIILVNMPLAMIGGVLILVFTGGELNIPAIIGFISLLGISTRNGMLLITLYNRLAGEGVSLRQRIISGSADRLLPIVMTALTSALALIPLAVNGSAPGNEIQSPMAVVIIGGLISSTLLNIFVVPVLYGLNSHRQHKS